MSEATVVHVKKSVAQNKDEAERVIDSFLSTENSVPEHTKSQISRIQRDLQGLPPQIPDPLTTTST